VRSLPGILVDLNARASISAHDVRLEDISDLVGHSSTSFTETVYPS